MTRKHNHYFKDVSHLHLLDVYRVLDLFNVTNPCLQHAVKKLLVAGGRGAGKDIARDIQEAIDTLERWKEMQTEGKSLFAESVVPVTQPLNKQDGYMWANTPPAQYLIKPEDVITETYAPPQSGGFLMPSHLGVKLTHKPTDIVVQFHTERSQHANKALAWAELLRAVEKRVGVKPVVIGDKNPFQELPKRFSYDLVYAVGSKIDELGEMIHVQRMDGETDNAYRIRIQTTAYPAPTEPSRDSLQP